MKNLIGIVLCCITFTVSAQVNFGYELQLTPVAIPNLPGLHSYAFAQYEGKWLVLGGRKDGLHARQPFNAFPQNQNNTIIYLIDVVNASYSSADITSLPVAIQEQLQSTNMNFYQDQNTLYLAGGYGYSVTNSNHITHNKLLAIDVSGLSNAIIEGNPINSYFKQLVDDNMAITGGQMGKIGNRFYLVGGHRFDGRYNPMNNPTYTQTYSNQIRSFEIENTTDNFQILNYQTQTDALHLHRRDYNLVPQVFPSGELGYTISSGVFQTNADLPFLYPIDLTSTGYTPQTGFNQYLSNYHSGKSALYSAQNNAMYSLFFGGMSQYQWVNNTLIQDNLVPFVKTISCVERKANGDLFETKLPVEMPNLHGAGAEFIYNTNLPHYENEVIKMDEITANEFVIGYLYGGIKSSSQNPFSSNQTSLTQAESVIYEVKLTKNPDLGLPELNGSNPLSFGIFPNPIAISNCALQFNIPYAGPVHYFLSSVDGKIIAEGDFKSAQAGLNHETIQIPENNTEMLLLTLVFDSKYFATQKVLRE
ncbi:MAG: hypothetical protein FGM16_03025 [Flavobacterium sp.]|nr:hypothetical protein [Flavobacterium sp.]